MRRTMAAINGFILAAREIFLSTGAAAGLVAARTSDGKMEKNGRRGRFAVQPVLLVVVLLRGVESTARSTGCSWGGRTFSPPK